MQTFERNFQPNEAIKAAQKDLDNSNIKYKIEKKGSKIPVYKCYLFDSSGKEISCGNGKGIGEQSKASAIFEAMEHLYSKKDNQSNIEIASYKVLDIPSLETVKFSRPIEVLIEKYPDAEIDCRKYISLDNSTYVYYPLRLKQPECFEKFFSEELISTHFNVLRKYSTNSGSAIGMDLSEALLHGINELIERDSLSIFLIKNLVKQSEDKLRVIDNDTLPNKLNSIVSHIEKVSNDKLLIIDITTDLNIPSFCCTFTKQSTPRQPFGLGTSLSKEYALERAILESLQCYYCVDPTLIEEDRAILAKFKGLPNYYESAKFNVVDLIEKLGALEIHYEKLLNYQSANKVEDQLDIINNILNKKGYKVFYALNYKSDSGITSIDTIIPGLETFNLVMAGQAVTPSKRGFAC